MIDESFSWYYN
jgi:polypyrimidine tract-binding protein 2